MAGENSPSVAICETTTSSIWGCCFGAKGIPVASGWRELSFSCDMMPYIECMEMLLWNEGNSRREWLGRTLLPLRYDATTSSAWGCCFGAMGIPVASGWGELSFGCDMPNHYVECMGMLLWSEGNSRREWLGRTLLQLRYDALGTH